MILREGDPTTPPHDGFYLLQSGEVVCHLPGKEMDPSSPGGHTVALRKLATPSSPRRATGGASGGVSGGAPGGASEGQGGAAVESEEGEADAALSLCYWEREWNERRGNPNPNSNPNPNLNPNPNPNPNPN